MILTGNHQSTHDTILWNAQTDKSGRMITPAMKSLLMALALLTSLRGAPATENSNPTKSIYVTWIMIWNGSTETKWWKPDDYNGCKVLVNGTAVFINWDSEADTQRWLIRQEGEKFRIIHKASGEALDWDGDKIMTRSKNASSTSQQWSCVEVTTI